jgi:hypothetical protein
MPLEPTITSTQERPPAPRRSRILRVRNNEPNKTVFAKVIDGNMVKIDFSAKGHPGDEQRVPLSVADDTDFLNSLEMGTLEVIDGPEDVIETLQFETEQVRRERAEANSRYTEVLDRSQDRDIVGTTCIGPAPTGRTGKCGRSLIQQASQAKEQPPLCDQHAHLSPHFFLAESGSRGEDATETRDGIVRREWREVKMTERQRQL